MTERLEQELALRPIIDAIMSAYKWGMFDANGFPIEIGPHSRWQLVQGSADLNPFYKV